MTCHPGWKGTSGLESVGTGTPSSRLTEIRKYSPLGASEREYLFTVLISTDLTTLSMKNNSLPSLLVA